MGAGSEAPIASKVRRSRSEGWGFGYLQIQGLGAQERCNHRLVSQPVEREGVQG